MILILLCVQVYKGHVSLPLSRRRLPGLRFLLSARLRCRPCGHLSFASLRRRRRRCRVLGLRLRLRSCDVHLLFACLLCRLLLCLLYTSDAADE